MAALFLCGPAEARRSSSSGKSRAKSASKSDDRAAAESERLQAAGAAALQAGGLAEAGRLLTAAYRAEPSPQGLYLLGRLAVAEGRELDAHDLFRRFLADPDLERESDREAPARPQAAPPAPSANPPAAPAAPPATAPTPPAASTPPTASIPPTASTSPTAPPAPTAPGAPTAALTATPTAPAATPAAAPAAPATPAPPESPEAAAIREAERYLARPRPPAGTLNILGERGTLILVDGRLVGVLPLPLPLLIAPNEHKVVLERANQRIEDQVQIAAGRLGELRGDVSSRALLLSILPGVLLVSDFAALSPELRARLQQSLEQALLSRRRSPLPSELALTLVSGGRSRLTDCIKDAACQVELANQVEADAVLTVGSEVKDGKLRLRVGLLDTTVGEEAASEEQLCDKCPVEQAGGLLRDQVGRVYETGTARGRAQLSVRCDPEDAELTVDGRAIPGGRFKKAVFAGLHRLRLSQPGVSASEREVTLREGDTREERMTLSIPEPPPAALTPPPPPPPRPAPRRPLWRWAVGGVALAGGLVMTGFGAAMLRLDGRCVVDATLPGEQCERLYATGAPGGAVLGIGLALAVGGGILWALPPPRH